VRHDVRQGRGRAGSGAALAARIAPAVEEVVRKQAGAGVAWSTTARCRSPPTPPTSRTASADSAGPAHLRLPGPGRISQSRQARVRRPPGRSRRRTPGCNAGDQRADLKAARRTWRTSKAATAKVKAHETFMSAARRRDRLFSATTTIRAGNVSVRDRGGDAPGVRDGGEAGVILQIDCPDLGMGRHIQLRRPVPRRLQEEGAAAHRSLEPRALRHSVEQLRMHLCWGNYEGPHHCDVPLADIIA